MDISTIINNQHQHFCFLTDNELQQIQQASVYHSYKKGQVLFHYGDNITNIFLIVNGFIKLERVDITGTFTYLQFKKADCIIPYLNLSKDNKHYLSAIAHTDIDIIAIPINIFQEILDKNDKQTIVHMKEQLTEMRAQIIKIQKGSMNNALHRVTTTLAIIYQDIGKLSYPHGTVVVECPLTVNDIARASGTTRDTASNVLKNLITAKKISYKHKFLTFLDRDYFDSLLNN